MKSKLVEFVLIFIFVEITTAAIFNSSVQEVKTNDINEIVALAKSKQSRRNNLYKVNPQSTSSSNEKANKKEKSKDDSLKDSMTISSTDSELLEKQGKQKKKKRKPESSKERSGWRKWHRKCQQCPEDMKKKWRDPSILWICGAYQRARRSFKSTCMMHYRNCQDGTMFTKVSDRRCQNSSGDAFPHGRHFFYEYRALLSGDSTVSKSSSSSDKSESTSWSVSKERKNFEKWEKEQNKTKATTKKARK